VLIAVDSLSSVRKAHAHTPAATHQAAWDVHAAVASPRHYSWLWAIGHHDAQVGVAEAASGLWTVGASSDIACEMRLTHIKLAEPGTGTVFLGTSVLRADVREGFLFGAGSLCNAAPGAFAFSVERTVTVEGVSWVDAEGNIVIPRGLTRMVLAVGRVNSGSTDGVVHMLPVTAHNPTLFTATGGHRVGSPRRSGARHEGVYDFDVMGQFDRWVTGSGCCCGAAMPERAVDVPNSEASEAWCDVCVIGEQVCLICSPVVVVDGPDVMMSCRLRIGCDY
jgi:hypothetical protein